MLAERRKAPIFVRVILGALLLSSALLLQGLTDHYEKTCPPGPDEQAGVNYSLDEHVSVVYLTLAQYRKILAVRTYFFGSALCVVILVIWESRRAR